MELRLLSLIESSLHQTGSIYTGDEVSFHCPICNLEIEKKKLVINLNRNSNRFGYWHCWNCRESMGTSGKTIYSLFKKVHVNENNFNKLNELLSENCIKLNIPTEKKYDNIVLPSEFISLSKKRISPEYNNAISYLNKRGITLDDIITYNIGYCESGYYKQRIIIPSYDQDGDLNYFISRTYYNGINRKYKNPKVDKDNIVFFESNINYNYPLLLVEGVFDAISAKRNAIPLLGKSIGKELKRKILLNKINTIYLSLDSDAMGASINHINEFISNGINVKLIKLDKHDPSEVGYKNFIELYKNAVDIDFSELIKLKLKYEGRKIR